MQTSMLPPPLSQHVTKQQQQHQHQRSTDLPSSNIRDRRAESRYSDISMHAGCTAFPGCTTEDAEGHIVHSSPSMTLPAGVVRGRKEGPSPSKRKYIQKIDIHCTIANHFCYSSSERTRLSVHSHGPGSLARRCRDAQWTKQRTCLVTRRGRVGEEANAKRAQVAVNQ